jgi:hypothetical protein
MNERIGKLAVEAGAYWDHGDWNMPSSVYFSERDLEKFAELIVRECVGVVEGGSFLHNQAPTAIFARECSSAIKRHFGV